MRLASETEEERAAMLQQMSANQRHRLATETEEERAARLQRMKDRLASETEEERAARLQQMSANQYHRLAAETGNEREANVHMQHCLSRHRVVEYCAKYATKCEPCSHLLNFSLTLSEALRMTTPR